MEKYLIYGLYCPFTGNLHYVGQSSCGMLRPKQHLTESHTEKIKDWVRQLRFLGYKPIIKILEYCNETNIGEREIYWIAQSINDGCYLLNIVHNRTDDILSQKEYFFEYQDIVILGEEIRKERKSMGLSQEQLSNMAKIDRSTLVRIESGNRQVTLKNIKNVLSILGFELFIKKKNDASTNEK